MKLLLYCTKAKPYLYPHFNNLYFTKNKDFGNVKLNGKIVAECDFEVEEIFEELYGDLDWQHDYLPTTNTMDIVNLERESCLDREELCDYRYVIHIKNLHIFDEPLELNNILYEDDTEGHYGVWEVERAPADYTIIATDVKDIGGVYCCRGTYGRFLAVSSRELCDILNGKKTIVVRKKVLKEVLKC